MPDSLEMHAIDLGDRKLVFSMGSSEGRKYIVCNVYRDGRQIEEPIMSEWPEYDHGMKIEERINDIAIRYMMSRKL